MKTRLFALFLLLPMGMWGQTVLHSFPLTLKKPADRQALLLATNDAKGLYLLASDKERATVFSYNSAVFLRDSLSAERPDKKYAALAGYSCENNAFTVYWATDDLDKVLATRYDFQTRSVNTRLHTFDYGQQTLMASFTENGAFYVVTASDQKPELTFYRFHSGAPETHTVDFSRFILGDTGGRPVKWNELFLGSGIQKMETSIPNPAAAATAPVKLYKTAEGFVLTVDVNRRQTNLYEIGADFTLSEKTIPMAELPDAERQNSFYHENRLYQLVVAEEGLILTCTDLATMTVIGTHTADSKHDISFRNSPLMAQTNDSDAHTIRDSKRFLRRLSGSRVGVSVYRTPEDLLLTIGGMRDVATTGDVLLGIAAGTSIALGGGFGDLGIHSNQFVFFDALFDDAFRHKDMPPQLLAMDKLIESMEDQNTPSSLTVFGKDVIQAVYDAADKEIVLRRFRDGRGE